jgi:aminoglycoside phosphotransferase (APT) family kinase protein
MNRTANNNDFLRADAERIVAQVSGATIARVTRVDAGVMTFKYFVKSWQGHHYVVRFYPRNRGAVVRYEPDVIQLCHKHGMRVPEVIASSRTGPTASLEYMVYRMIPGISMQAGLASFSPRSLSRICRGLIDQLRLLNEIKPDGFGDLVDCRQAWFDSWFSFVGHAFGDGIACARAQSLLSPVLLDAVELIGQHLGRFQYVGRPSLCWGDISPENVIVGEGGEIAGLVDFEGVLGCEFHLNLGYLRARYAGSRFYTTFAELWPGGCHEAISARSALYVIVRALRLMSHGREPLPTGILRERLDIFLPGLEEAVDESLKWIGQRSLAVQR